MSIIQHEIEFHNALTKLSTVELVVSNIKTSECTTEFNYDWAAIFMTLGVIFKKISITISEKCINYRLIKILLIYNQNKIFAFFKFGVLNFYDNLTLTLKCLSAYRFYVH